MSWLKGYYSLSFFDSQSFSYNYPQDFFPLIHNNDLFFLERSHSYEIGVLKHISLNAFWETEYIIVNFFSNENISPQFSFLGRFLLSFQVQLWRDTCPFCCLVPRCGGQRQVGHCTTLYHSFLSKCIWDYVYDRGPRTRWCLPSLCFQPVLVVPVPSFVFLFIYYLFPLSQIPVTSAVIMFLTGFILFSFKLFGPFNKHLIVLIESRLQGKVGRDCLKQDTPGLTEPTS